MKKNPITPLTNVKTQKDRHQRPENKDNLDSRKNEEQDVKADDITHNKKGNKNQKPFQHKEH